VRGGRAGPRRLACPQAAVRRTEVVLSDLTPGRHLANVAPRLGRDGPGERHLAIGEGPEDPESPGEANFGRFSESDRIRTLAACRPHVNLEIRAANRAANSFGQPNRTSPPSQYAPRQRGDKRASAWRMSRAASPRKAAVQPSRRMQACERTIRPMPIYLDNAQLLHCGAKPRGDAAVPDRAVRQCLFLHGFGRLARAGLDEAHEKVAVALGATPREISSPRAGRKRTTSP